MQTAVFPRSALVSLQVDLALSSSNWASVSPVQLDAGASAGTVTDAAKALAALQTDALPGVP